MKCVALSTLSGVVCRFTSLVGVDQEGKSFKLRENVALKNGMYCIYCTLMCMIAYVMSIYVLQTFNKNFILQHRQIVVFNQVSSSGLPQLTLISAIRNPPLRNLLLPPRIIRVALVERVCFHKGHQLSVSGPLLQLVHVDYSER